MDHGNWGASRRNSMIGRESRHRWIRDTGVPHGTTACSLVAWYGMAWHGMIWHGTAWHGMEMTMYLDAVNLDAITIHVDVINK